jgi:hypothetical protein
MPLCTGRQVKASAGAGAVGDCAGNRPGWCLQVNSNLPSPIAGVILVLTTVVLDSTIHIPAAH